MACERSLRGNLKILQDASGALTYHGQMLRNFVPLHPRLFSFFQLNVRARSVLYIAAVVSLVNVLEDVFDAGDGRAVLEVHVAIVFQRQPRIVGNDPPVVDIKMRVTPLQAMNNASVSSTVRRIAGVVDDCFGIEFHRIFLRTNVTVHAGRVSVVRTARPVNHVPHDDVVQSRIEGLVGNFGAYRSVNVLRSYRSIATIDPDEHVAVRQTALLEFDDLDSRDSKSENLTFLNVFDKLDQLEMENARYHVGTIGSAQVVGDVFRNFSPLGIAGEG